MNGFRHGRKTRGDARCKEYYVLEAQEPRCWPIWIYDKLFFIVWGSKSVSTGIRSFQTLAKCNQPFWQSKY